MAKGIGPKGRKKVAQVMKEGRAGRLRSGSPLGPVVTKPQQKVAIALSEGRRVSRGGGR
jgi:predicted DNA-binding protein (UPF0251 family)